MCLAKVSGTAGDRLVRLEGTMELLRLREVSGEMLVRLVLLTREPLVSESVWGSASGAEKLVRALVASRLLNWCS